MSGVRVPSTASSSASTQPTSTRQLAARRPNLSTNLGGTPTKLSDHRSTNEQTAGRRPLEGADGDNPQ